MYSSEYILLNGRIGWVFFSHVNDPLGKVCERVCECVIWCVTLPNSET